MFGPGLALRGGEGAQSMHKAVENMKRESTQCFRFFILQLLFFHVSSFLLMWLYYPLKVAILINLILLGFLGLFVKSGWEIYSKLYVNDDEAISGQFKDFTQYENMYDLDDQQRRERQMQGQPMNDYNNTREEGGGAPPEQIFGRLARFVNGKGPSPERRYRSGSDDPYKRSSATKLEAPSRNNNNA